MPVHAMQLALSNMALQSYEDSHPLVGLESLLNIPLVQEEIAVQVDAFFLEQAVHVPVENMSLQSNNDSHPLVGSASLLKLLAEHEPMAVQVDSLEVAADVHALHNVTPASTAGHPASHPLLI